MPDCHSTLAAPPILTDELRPPALRHRLALLVLASVLPLLVVFCGAAVVQHRAARAQAEQAVLDLARGLMLGVDHELAAAADGPGVQAAIGVPVVREGQAASATSLVLHHDRLLALLHDPLGGPRPDARIALLDHDGAVLAATPSGAGMGSPAGAQAPPELLDRIRAAPEGILAHAAADGTVLQTAFSQSRLHGWTVAVSTAQAGLMAPAWRGMGILLACGAAALGLGLLLARAVAPWALAPMQVLAPMQALAPVQAMAPMQVMAAGTCSAAAGSLAPVAARRLGSLEASPPAEALHASGRPDAQEGCDGRELPATATSVRDLAASEARMRRIVDALPIMAWTLGLDGALMHGNQAWADYVGAAAAATLADRLELCHPEDRARTATATGVALSACTALDIQVRLRRQDGAYRWHRVRMTLLPGGGGTDPAFVATAQDIHRMQADAARLADAEVQLRLLQDGAGAGTWDWNISTGVVHWSEQQARLFGHSPDVGPIVHETWRSAIHPDDRDRVTAELDAALRHGAAYCTRYRILRTDGQVRWHQAWGEVRRNSSGKAVRMTGVNADITEREAESAALHRLTADLNTCVAAEAAARAGTLARDADARARAARGDALARLAGGVGRRMDRVLSMLEVTLPLIAANAGDPGLVRGLAAAAGRAAAQGAAVAGPLLALDGWPALRPRPVAVAPLLAGLRARLHPRLPGIQVRTEARDLPPLLADPDALDAVLDALADNARDAMPAGGILLVQVDTEAVGAAGPAPAALAAGRYLRITVADTGAGMDAEVLLRAGEPFFSTKPGGLGLGLAAARGLVRRLGGGIDIGPAPGGGTQVTLWLPQAALRGTAPVPVWPDMSMLLVADRPGTREAACDALAGSVGQVVVAPDVPCALALLGAGLEVDALVACAVPPEELHMLRQASPALPTLALAEIAEMQDGIANLCASVAATATHQKFTAERYVG